jgi:oxygen-independent coproporphyrinogen-3 oxidase
VREGRETLADETEYAAEYLEAVARLEEGGYEAYEVSNFARPGRESRHNQAYWDGRAYVGLGPGAHSFVPPTRWWNVREWGDYQARVSQGLDAVAGTEVLGLEAVSLEKLWLGLRRREGIGLAELGPRQQAVTDGWLGQGWARRQAGRLSLTAEGWLRLDALAIALSAA